jgi:glycosyltransferase involved in cell wall biosynthesis
VAWEGSQFVYHSLAHVNREVCLDLAAQPDIDLSIVPYESHAFDAAADPRFHQLASRFTPDAPTSAAVHVRHQWPPRFEAPRHGAWVMIQPWEFGGLPAEWIAPMRDQVDEIWVPSEWVRDCYIRSGIPAEKVVVIPNGVDTSLYRPDGRKLPLSTRKSLKLLFLGGTIGRKGIDVLLNTYLSTFTAEDDVCLVIKSNGTNGAYRGSAIDDEIRRVAAVPNAPEIELIADDLSDADVAALYRACDVLVHPYRGEGFGMPIAEAMASGLPVVVTNYGACLDFCDDEVGYLIPARLVEIPVPNGLPAPSIGYWWAEPNQVALGAVLREIVRDPSAARTRGAAGVRRMQSLTWKHVGARVRERLRVLADRTPLRFGSPAERAEAVEPLPLDGRRGTTLLLEPCWSEAAWEQALIAFGRTYGPQDDVTLVVRLDPAQGVSPEAAAARFEDVLRAAGLDPDHAPDVLLVPDDLDARGVQRLHAAADHRLPPGPAAVEMLAKIAARRDLPRAA